jgi:serine/threonine protein kinase
MKFCPACNTKYDDNVSFCPKDGEVLEEDPNSFVGSVLDGQYQIEALLGRGGMGAVYRARHILLGDRVAIKMLPPEMRSNTEWLRRFQREGQAARRFRHPNAVTVYDLRTSGDGIIYLVMEYVEGTTLDVELKRRGRFSPADALTTLKPVMSVLNAAHAMGVVHRDLKPENIMIGKAGTGGEPVVKLLDLGIAKLREVAGAEKTGSTNLTVAGQMLGTPYYMSPEQWGELPEDGNSDIDGRADIYSLGVVFYEIVAGKRPFSGMTILELRKQHVSETPKPLHEVTTGVTANFSQAIQRAMSKDRAQRQDTASELEKELEIGLDGAGLVSAAIPATIVGPAPSDRFTTVADRPTPTVDDSAAMTMLDGGAEVSPSVPSQVATMPTVVVSAEELAAREAAKARPGPQAIPQPRVDAPSPKKRSPLILIAGILVVLLIVMGAGGFGLWRYFSSRGTGKPANTTTDAHTTTTDAAAPLHEVARYWIQVNTENSGDANRAGELISLRSGQEFKFHFSPNENGYLYIIGPGNENAPTIFLSGQPGPMSGLDTNEVKSGTSVSFPEDTMLKANFIRLDETSGTDEFTFVFSPSAITTPAFFAGPSQHQLTAEELKQWADFQEQAKANAATIEVIKTGASPQTAVKVPQNGAETASVVFRVRIEHR